MYVSALSRLLQIDPIMIGAGPRPTHHTSPSDEPRDLLAPGSGSFGVNPETGNIERGPRIDDLVYRPGSHPGSVFGLDPETGVIELKPIIDDLVARPSTHPGSVYHVDPDTGSIDLAPIIHPL